MNISELAQRIQGTIVVEKPDADIASVYSGDLLSDIMGHCGDASALISIQNHLNTIAVCTLVGVEAVIICHARPIPDDMKEAAAREGVGILTTPLSQFACAKALADLPASAK